MTAFTPEDLQKLLRYDDETGKLFWRHRSPEMFKPGKHPAVRVCQRWNTRYAGQEAFTNMGRGGARNGVIFCTPLKAHRVIWAMCTGRWPVSAIDHIDNNPQNNKIGNLRESTTAQNAMNMRITCRNTSGVKGVYWKKGKQKWLAQITAYGVVHHVGYFTEKDDATAAISEARARLHGEFARQA